MKFKQILWIGFCCLLSISGSGQLNNIIFLGGNGNGSTSLCYKLKSNNTVFGGGIGKGDISVCYTDISNNPIYAGANGDGNGSTCYTLTSNNSIFAGGDADGNTTFCFLEMPNNPIFAGANGDGNGSLCFSSISNNSIFAGGLGDGIIATNFLSISNNMIFAGGHGDGVHLGELLLQQSTIVWHGRFSSNWHNPDNWDQNRIPTINDIVIIRTEVHDPLLVAGWLGVGDQTSPIKEFARHVHILNGSVLTLDQTSRANIQQDLFVYGSLQSLNGVDDPVLYILNGGTLTVSSQGFVEMKTQ